MGFVECPRRLEPTRRPTGDESTVAERVPGAAAAAAVRRSVARRLVRQPQDHLLRASHRLLGPGDRHPPEAANVVVAVLRTTSPAVAVVVAIVIVVVVVSSPLFFQDFFAKERAV